MNQITWKKKEIVLFCLPLLDLYGSAWNIFRDEVEVYKNAEKEKGKYPAILTE